MASTSIHFYSTTLLKACSMTVLLPDRAESDGDPPLLYLLHGLSDDHTVWSRRTSIERYVHDMPLIVVMPDGGRSFYCDAVRGPAYETHLIRDVVGFVDRFFQTVAERRARAIGGLSMGGYGALKLALQYPELFCSAHSHSGALDITLQEPETVRADLREEFPLIFGSHPADGKDCLFGLADRADPDVLPALRIDCGTDDSLLEANRRYHRHLDSLEIAHEYEELDGGHTWDYWDRRIREALLFHRRGLGI